MLIAITTSRLVTLHRGRSGLRTRVLGLYGRLPRCRAIVTVCNIKGSAKPRLVTRLNSVHHFPRHDSVITFTNMSPNIINSNGVRLSDITASGHKSPRLEGTLFRIISACIGHGPRGRTICRFCTGGHSRKGPFFIYAATTTGGFLHVCCTHIGRYLGTTRDTIRARRNWFMVFVVSFNYLRFLERFYLLCTFLLNCLPDVFLQFFVRAC